MLQKLLEDEARLRIGHHPNIGVGGEEKVQHLVAELGVVRRHEALEEPGPGPAPRELTELLRAGGEDHAGGHRDKSLGPLRLLEVVVINSLCLDIDDRNWLEVLLLSLLPEKKFSNIILKSVEGLQGHGDGLDEGEINVLGPEVVVLGDNKGCAGIKLMDDSLLPTVDSSPEGEDLVTKLPVVANKSLGRFSLILLRMFSTLD